MKIKTTLISYLYISNYIKQIINNMLLSTDKEEKTTNNYGKIIVCTAQHNGDINKYKVIYLKK